MAADKRHQELADYLREELAGVKALRRASPALFSALSRLMFLTTEIKDRVHRHAVGVQWGRDAQRVARELKPALNRLRKVLLRCRPPLDHQFEKALPEWRSYLVALHRLVPVAEELAERASPLMPRRGRPPELAHRLAWEVAAVLDQHGVRLTQGARGAFGEVLSLMLSCLDATEATDVAALTKAVIRERNASGGNSH